MQRFRARAGVSMAINTGTRARVGEWARCFHEAYGELHGIYYASSMHANQFAVALSDRAEDSDVLARHPDLNRALADDTLLDMLKVAAAALGHGLR